MKILTPQNKSGNRTPEYLPNKVTSNLKMPTLKWLSQKQRQGMVGSHSTWSTTSFITGHGIILIHSRIKGIYLYIWKFEWGFPDFLVKSFLPYNSLACTTRVKTGSPLPCKCVYIVYVHARTRARTHTRHAHTHPSFQSLIKTQSYIISPSLTLGSNQNFSSEEKCFKSIILYLYCLPMRKYLLWNRLEYMCPGHTIWWRQKEKSIGCCYPEKMPWPHKLHRNRYKQKITWLWTIKLAFLWLSQSTS